MKKMRFPIWRRGMHRACLSLCITGTLCAHTPGIHAQAASGPQAQQDADVQQQNNNLITLTVKDEKLVVVLEKIERQTGLIFVYANDEVNVQQRVSISVANKTVEEVSRLLLQPLGIRHILLKDKVILQPANARSPLPDGGTGQMDNPLNPENTASRPAPSTIITGRITDEAGNGVGGASITVKGTTIGTVAREDGSFSLVVPDGVSVKNLEVSSVGFLPLSIAYTGQQNLRIAMVGAAKELEDAVVVAYGTQRRSSVTGAVDMVGRKEIEGRPVTNLSTALQGLSPNLIIQQRNFEPGQGVNINIRGLGTLGDNTPLIVIDGIIGGDINLINPIDIESISILKDAGSAAIYGSRSANGVLLITTKKGRKNQAPVITYNGIFGTQVPRVPYTPVSAWENAYFKNESLANSGLSPAFTPQQIRDFATRGDGDWRVNNILRNAPQQTHNLSFTGGGANSTYMVSLGYLDQQNNFVGPNYGYKRYNVRLNNTNEFGRFKLNTLLSYVKVQGKDHSFSTSTLLVDATRVPLYYSFQDSAGNYLTNPVSAQYNPKAILENGGARTSNDDEIFGNLNAELAITNDLKIRGVFGATVRSNTSFNRRLELTFLPGGAYGNDREVYDENTKSLFTNLQLMAEYGKIFGSHDFRVLAGASNESFISEGSRVLKTLTDPSLGIPTTGTVVSPTGSFNTIQATNETSINSLFGRLMYNYQNRYFAEFNVRYDGSSKFAENNRWGVFPSAAVAWRLSEEPFMQRIKSRIGEVKIRSSYGLLGNQNVNAYQYQTSFFNFANAYGFNNAAVGGAGFILGNPDLTWEKAANFNIGADFTLLKRRLEVSVEYFNKTTSDILYVRRDVPQLFGAAFPDFNVAKVRNQGWDLKATYNMSGRKFSQSISVNVGDNLNELLELTSGAAEQIERREEFELLRRVGQPITTYYGYRTNGLYQNLDEINRYPRFANATVTAGDLKFVDKNADGVIDDQDKFILGNPFPRYTFGFTYNASYKGIDFSFLIQGVGRRDAMVRGEQVEPFHFGYGGTMYTHQTDYWTPTNPGARYPRLAEAGSPSNTNNYRTGSDIYLFDAAYMRLKNVQLGYTIPATVARRAGLQQARIYFTAQNVLTLSKLNFLDPETTEFDNNTGFNASANSARAYFLPVFYGGGLTITFLQNKTR